MTFCTGIPGEQREVPYYEGEPTEGESEKPSPTICCGYDSKP